MSDVPDAFALGAITARLDDHDRRFAVINGSQATTAAKLTEIALAIQSLVDSDKARDETVLVTAKTLKESQEARWSMPTRLSIVLGGFCALAILVLTIYLAFRHNTITQLPTKGSQ